MPEEKKDIEHSDRFEDLNPEHVLRFLPGWNYEESKRKVGENELHTGWTFRKDVNGTSYELSFLNATGMVFEISLISSRDGTPSAK